MLRNLFIAIMLAGWSLLTVLGGCAHQAYRDTADADENAVQSDGGDYSKEISEHDETARTAPDASERMQAHLKLARLYMSYKNPQHDYEKALKHLQIYASLQPNFANDQELRDWLTALKQMERQRQEIDQSQQEISKLKKANKRLTLNNAKLKTANNQLTESNAALTETIELLKNIDRNIEEKRKNYSSH